MHATSFLAGGDEDVKAQDFDTTIDADEKRSKSKAEYAAAYTPYQDALYYGNDDRRRSDRYQDDNYRGFDPDERVVEERWGRRRWTRGGEDEPDFYNYARTRSNARDDPYDPDSNQRYDGRRTLQYDPTEDVLRKQRFDAYSNGGRTRRNSLQQQTKDQPLDAFVPVPLAQEGGLQREKNRRKRIEQDIEEFDNERGYRRGKSHGRYDDEEDRYEDRGRARSEGGRSTRGRRSRSRRRRSSRSRSESRRRKVAPQDDPYKPEEKYTFAKAAKAAAWVAAIEAWRCRKEEGPWTGQKGRRVLVASSVGVAIGALRNGRLLDAGQKPYADAAMTGFYGIDFLKRVAKHTEHEKGALREQRDWREEADGRAPWQTEGRERARR